MSNLRPTKVFVIILFTLLISCTKESPREDPEEVSDYSYSPYITQSNQEDIILANVYNAGDKSYLYYYGSTDDFGNPLEVKSMAYQRMSSDTVYNFILDESFRINFMYATVGGVKDPFVQKLSYVGADSVYYALYYYDWDTREDSLLYMASVHYSNDSYSATTVYGKTGGTPWIPALQSIGSGLHVGSGVLAAVGVGIAGIAFFSAPAWLAAVGTITIATAWFGGNANAGTTRAPGSGEPGSPSAGLTLNLIGTPYDPSPCNGVSITFDAKMDQFGSILITNPNGGYDYEYSLNGSPFQESQIFNGPYSPGSFLIQIKNGNGCVKSMIRTISPYVALKVGDAHQGGIICYLLGVGEQGYDPNNQHGVIVTAFDQSTGAKWGCYGTWIGKWKTEDIVNSCPEPGIAARICYDLVLNGYDDWLLPDRYVLGSCFKNRLLIGGFSSNWYWNTWEDNSDGTEAQAQYFGSSGNIVGFSKNELCYVRAVRYF